MRDGRVYWTAPESQFYAEPKRLAAAGYLSATKEPGRTHERTHYMLTDSGRDALAQWLATPTRFPRIQNEPIVRLLGEQYAERGVLLESLAALRTELHELDESLKAAERARVRPPAPCKGPAAKPPSGPEDRRCAPAMAGRGRSRVLKVPLQLFRSNGASVDSPSGAVSLSQWGAGPLTHGLFLIPHRLRRARYGGRSRHRQHARLCARSRHRVVRTVRCRDRLAHG